METVTPGECCPTCGQKVRAAKPYALTDEQRMEALHKVFNEYAATKARITMDALIAFAMREAPPVGVECFTREVAAMRDFIKASPAFKCFPGKGGGVERL